MGLIWTSEFILACQQMVVAGSVAMWYFTRYFRNDYFGGDKKKINDRGLQSVVWGGVGRI